MAQYGASLGMKDEPPSLSVLGSQTQDGGGVEQPKRKCNECNSFACKRQLGSCICKWNSKFNLNEIKQKGRRDYVQMVRAYNKAYPDKSLKVSVKIVKSALEPDGDAAGGGASNQSSVNFMASVSQVLGDEVSDPSALDAWLAQHNGEMTEGIFVMGDLSGDGDVKFEIVEDSQQSVAQEPGSSENALAASSGSFASAPDLTGSSSSSSTRSVAATAAERENAKLRASLQVAKAQMEQQATELAAVRAQPASETPAATQPNYALDRPTEPSMAELTPRELYKRFKAMTPDTPGVRFVRAAVNAVRRTPAFTPSTRPIAEEPETPGGGANSSRKGDEKSSAELMASGIVAAEKEKRQIARKLDKRWTLKWLLRFAIRRLVNGSTASMLLGQALMEYASEVPLHRLATLTLVIYAFGGKLAPYARAIMRWISGKLLKSAGTQIQALVARVREMVALALSHLVIAKAQHLHDTLASHRANGQTQGGSPSQAPASTGGGQAAPAVSQAPAEPPQRSVSSQPFDSPTAVAAASGGSTALVGLLAALPTESRLGAGVLMASCELKESDGLIPALMDDGASSGTSCTRSLVGALPGTFKPSDKGHIGVGSDGATLESLGSYLFALERFGTNGSEKVLRRLKHTPNLPMAMVFSEATENKEHGYGIYWPPHKQRWLESPDGNKIEMFMSSTNLGWLKVRMVTNPGEVAALLKKRLDQQKRENMAFTLMHDASNAKVESIVSTLAAYRMALQRTCTSFAQPQDEAMACMGRERVEELRETLRKKIPNEADADDMVDEAVDVLMDQYSEEDQKKMQAERIEYLQGLHTMDPSAVRTVSMGSVKGLKGVALLRRRHCIDGHVALPITVKNLRLEGAFDDGRVTLKHVELFAKQGCGACESAKMRRRAFTLKVEPEDPTPPRLGAMWTFDVLELRVPSEHTGATFLYIAIEKVSKVALTGPMKGYSEENVTSCLNEIRARVRPKHGEIEILRMDSHPSHRSKHVRDYSAEVQQRLQLSPGYVHEGVGDCENFLLHNVPSANALLLTAPHLGETHFAQAFAYIVEAKNHCVTHASDPPTSPAMVYHKSSKYFSSGLQVFGAEAKALVHGEARDSKFDLHAKPCVYVGPPIDSDSRAHAAVWYKKNYVDVDLGCLAVNEDIVLDRSRRNHPCTQPYNQVAGASTVDVGRPTSLFDLCGTQYEQGNLPNVEPIIWVRSMPVPTEYFVFLLWHGELRPGDMTSWLHELGAGKVVPYPIDIVLGGQEHNLSRKPIKAAILEHFKSERCLGGFAQPRCKHFSAARFKQPGPPVLFDLDHVNGVPDEDGELPPEVVMTLSEVAFVASFFRAAANSEKVMMLEYPASQAESSPYAAKGREKHATIADTDIMRKAIEELELELIYTEQGAAGAKTRKPTTIVTTKNGAHALRRTVGTLYVKASTKSGETLLGRNDDGSFKTAESEVYTSEFAMRLTIALIGSMSAIVNTSGEVVATKPVPPATDDLFPIGTRVELWWYKDNMWYRGTVMDTRVRKGMVHGESIPRREIQVRYDADDELLWHAVCDYSVREAPNEENLAVLNLLAEREMAYEAASAVGIAPGDSLNIMFPACEDVPSQPSEAAMNPLEAHKGEVFSHRDVLLDLADGSALNTLSVLVVMDDGNVAKIDVANAHNWHIPSNEKEYEMSPQRDLWRTAKELKMDKYAALNNGRGMYDLVLRSSVDLTKHKIYNTKWVYQIKFKEGGLVFEKLNPRWCVMGGSMDPRLFKSYAEMMRHTSMNVLWGLKAMYFDQLSASSADLSDAFQATTTVDEKGELKQGMVEFYTTQPAGFEKYGPNGEKLVCRQKCFMQGRIDATNGFDARFVEILTMDAKFKPLLWDAKVLLYHNSDLTNTTSSLDEIIAHCDEIVRDGKDSPPQDDPRG